MTRFVAALTMLFFATLLLAAVSGCREAIALNPTVDVKVAKELRAGSGSGESGHAAAAEPTGTGWGTLKGKFVYAGDAPSASFFSTGGKDGAVCGQQVPNQQLVVDSASKGVANIVVFARKVSRVFKPEEGAAAAPPAPVFDQKGCLFLSHVFATQMGVPLEIKNSDPVSHNTSFDPGGGNTPANPLLQPNSSVTYKFSRAMNAPAAATCSIHPWMKGYIIARDDPYFAVTGPDGSFEIKNVPAGEDVEFQVWHEQAPGGLEAKPGWSKGRFKIKIPADGEQDLGTIEVPAATFH
ncbi:MAG TPA: hypothetical protein VGG64_11085 [Pirellulales bacterium]